MRTKLIHLFVGAVLVVSRSARAEDDFRSFKVAAEGLAQTTLDGGEPTPAAGTATPASSSSGGASSGGAAFGLGLAYEGPWSDVSLLLHKGTATTYSSSQDAFGTFMLQPSIASTSLTYRHRMFPFIVLREKESVVDVGFSLRADVAKSAWEITIPPAFLGSSVQTVESTSAVAYSVFIGPAIRYWPRISNYNRTWVTVAFGYSGHFLGGNIANARHSFARGIALGTSRRDFHGVEAIVGIRLADVEVSVGAPFIVGEVDGLTGGQLVFTVSLRGGLELLTPTPTSFAIPHPPDTGL